MRSILHTFYLLMLCFAVTFCFSVTAKAQTGTATITTDKPDYAPRSTAIFKGSGFSPNENVILKVKNLSYPCNTVLPDSSYTPWTVTADDNGNFVTTWTVCDCAGDSLKLKATGQTSGLVAYALFSDAGAPLLSSATVTYSSGSATYGMGGTITYTVSATRNSNGNEVSSLSVGTLPKGITAAFSPANLSFSNPNSTLTSTLTLTVDPLVPAINSFSFTVTVEGGQTSGQPKINTTQTINNTITINKANQTITWSNPADITYGTLLSTTQLNAKVTGVSGGTEAGALTYTPVEGTLLNAGNSQTLHVDAAATSNYNAASKDVIINVKKANQSITWNTPTDITYGTALSATQLNAITSGNGALTYSPVAGTVLGAGSQTLSVTAAATTNYNQATGSVTLTIKQAKPTITLTVGGPYTYNGVAQGVQSAIVTGVAVNGTPENLGNALVTYNASNTVPVNAGSYAVVASFAGNNNYLAARNETGTLIINKAIASVVLGSLNPTYTGAPLAATATTTPTGLTVDLSYDGSTSAPTNAGSYAIVGIINDVNYQGSSSSTLKIDKAAAAIDVTPYTVTYDGEKHTAIGTAKGVKGETLSGLDLSGTTHTDAGAYNADAWTFNDVTGNYTNANGIVDDVIAKANATVNVLGYIGTYDGNAHGATGSAIGIGGVTLTGLDLGTSFTNAPGGTAHWTFTNTNYEDQSGAVNIEINKANASIQVTGYTVTYDAAEHTATGSAKGVKDEDLSSLLSLNGTSHTNAGIYNEDSWSFTGNTNYNLTSGTVNDIINKATATINVTEYSGTYDGDSHGASGTATGIGGTILDGLDLGSSFTNVPGGIANWTFTNSNYEDQSGDVNIKIDKADPEVSITNYNVTYDANNHIASGTAKGVKGEDLNGLDLTNTAHTDAGNYAGDTWSFTDVTGNYKDISATTITDVISKADAIIEVTPYGLTYDGNPHTVTGTAKGVKGEPLSGLDLSNTTHTNAGTYSTDNWSFTDATGNYNDVASTIIIDKIDKANATVNLTVGGPYTYNGAAQGVQSASVTGVAINGTLENLGSAIVTYNANNAVPVDAGSYAVIASFTGSNNYLPALDKNGTLLINKANQAITWSNPSDITYGTTLSTTQLNAIVAGKPNGSAPGALTYTPAAGMLLNAGNAQILHVDAAATGNYNSASKEVTINVNKAVTISSAVKTSYNGADLSCATSTDGKITVNATGGTGTLQYSNDNGKSFQASNEFSGLGAGAYKIVVKDATNSTSNISTVTITAPAAVAATVTPMNDHLYFGYAGDQTAVIKVSPTGGIAPYTVTISMSRKLICNYINATGDETWISTGSGGSIANTNTVCDANAPGNTQSIGYSIGTEGYLQTSATLLNDAVITVTVQDKNGCTWTKTYPIYAEDVRCFAGNSSVQKVQMCHRTGNAKTPCVSICVDLDATNEHLAHGDSFGACPKSGCNTNTATASTSSSSSMTGTEQTESYNRDADKLKVLVTPNPSVRGIPFALTITGKADKEVQIRVINILGKEVYRMKGAANKTYRLGAEFVSGIYVVQVIQDNQIQTVKIIKE